MWRKGSLERLTPSDRWKPMRTSLLFALTLALASALSTTVAGARAEGTVPIPGTVAWNFSSPTHKVFKPFVVHPVTTVFSTGAELVALSTFNGTVLWTHLGQFDRVAGSVDLELTVALNSASLQAFHTQTGARLWVTGDLLVDTSKPPVVANTTVVFISLQGYLHARFLSNGSFAWQNNDVNCSSSLSRLAFESDALFASCGTTLSRIHAASGQYVWKVAANAIYSPLPLGARVLVLVQTSAVPQLTANVTCFDFLSGDKLWSVTTSNYVFSSPTPGPNGDALVATWHRGGNGAWTSTNLLWMNPSNGTIAWSIAPDLSSGATYLSTPQVYVFGAYNAVSAVAFNGTFMWSSAFPGLVDHPPQSTVAQDAVVAADNVGSLMKIFVS